MKPSNPPKIDPSTVRILVIDDEPVVLKSCERILRRAGYHVTCEQDARNGLEKALGEPFHVVIVDLKMPGLDGMQVLDAIKAQQPELAVIMITGYSTVQTAMEAIKRGAADYVPKPFNPSELELVVKRILEKQNLLQEPLP